MAETKRIDWIDAAKGFAILLVMMGHSDPPEVVMTWLYTFHVPLFFFLSGYVFKIKNGENFLSFVRRKIFTLVVPMILFSIVSILIDVIYYCAILQSKSIISIWKRIPRIFINGRIDHFPSVFWFLSCLFVSEIIFFFLYRLRNRRVCFSAVLLLCSLVGWLSCTYMATPLPWSLDLVPISLFFIGCGVFVRRVCISTARKTYFFLLPIFLVLNIGLGAWNYMTCGKRVDIYMMDIGNYFLFYISALAGIGFTILLFQLFDFKHGITYIGRNSLIYYCMHYNIMIAAGNAVRYNVFHWNSQSLSFWGSLGISAMYVTIACVMLYFISKFINRYCPFMLGKFYPQKNKRKVTE